MAIGFQSINIQRWRQFNNVEINFHDRLTILTGANGSGKSTILKLLKGHFHGEADEKFIATPIFYNGGINYYTGHWTENYLISGFDNDFISYNSESSENIGNIFYSNGASSSINIPKSKGIDFKVKLSNPQRVPGVSIGSHSIPPRYSAVQAIPVSGIKPEDAFNDFLKTRKASETGENYMRATERRNNPLQSMKEALISFATFGVGNEFMPAVPEIAGLFQKFQDVLLRVLPREVGFERLAIRPPEVVVISRTGEFPIDSVSGGVMALIQTSWQIFLESHNVDGPFVTLIDEPENHLHPSMQRLFLSSIVDAFPESQFIIATHSPFIISSVENCYVYALLHGGIDGAGFQPTEPRSVYSTLVDHVNMAGPAAEVLRDVLGVSVTIPEWSARNLEAISQEFEGATVDKETLAILRRRLDDVGLSAFYPDVLERMMK